jgi:hypothetical protein
VREAYDDITSRLGEPQWWDENGTPRYCDFDPHHLSDVYADECCLLLIACQECGRRFKVAMSDGAWERALRGGGLSLREDIEGGWLHYGDPPFHDEGEERACLAGPTMNCDDLEVLEYWSRVAASEWTRDSALEGPLEEE